MEGTTRLEIELGREAEDDARELARLTASLREELLRLEVESVYLAREGAAPAGAKAADPVSWGTVLVTLAASGGVLTTLVGAVQSWLMRGERRSVKLKIGEDTLEVTNLSSKEQSRLIKGWVSRHRAD
ncbi:MAG TPA: hypothetical protein VGP08_06900 [Pyrinomonadaceae bacterium]|jgi:hypothetical protein|nr:hypothetical protein [Pyrinomonadaceae bacterium]